MKKIFYTGLLFFAVSCSSGENTNTNSAKGNSAGSNIAEMDTARLDTSGHSISAGSGQH